MNNKSGGSTIGKVLGAMLAAFITGGGLGGYTIYKYYIDKVENLSKTLGQLEGQLKIEQGNVENSNNELLNAKSKMDQLKQDIEDITTKWNNCIRPGKVVFVLDPVDTNSRQVKLRTNDQIELHLSSVSLFIKVVRVNKDGPVIKVLNCKNFHTRNAVKSLDDGDSAFQLYPNKSFKIKYSGKSCETGDMMFDSENQEEVTIALRTFEPEDQSLELEIQRKFLSRE